MAISVTYKRTHKHIVEWIVKDRWTVSDFEISLIKTGNMIQDNTPHKTNVIIDMQATFVFPTSVINSVIQLHYDNQFPENYGLSVIVSQMPMVRSLFTLFASSPITANRIFLASSMKEALEITCKNTPKATSGNSGTSSTNGGGLPSNTGIATMCNNDCQAWIR
jgi:hypothetical protein